MGLVMESADLRDTGPDQRRWLSLPSSRLVLNPFNGTTTLSPLQYSTGPEMPLNLGYYAADHADELASAVGLYRRDADRAGAVDVVWRDEFDSLDPAWTVGADVDAVADGQLCLELRHGAPHYSGAVRRSVEVDLDASPWLEIAVASVVDAWGLRVSRDGDPDIVIQPDGRGTGTFSYDIAERTGWSGVTRIELVLRAAVWGKPVRIDHLRFLAVVPVLVGAAERTVEWLPHTLPWRARYPDGSEAAGSDLLADVDTVLRTASLVDDADAGRWVVTGRFAGSASWDPAARTMTVLGERFAYAVRLSADLEIDGDAAFHRTQPELVAGLARTGTPTIGGFWSVPVRSGTGPTPFAAAVAFATLADGGAATAQARAGAVLESGDLDAVETRRRRFWDELLRRVPRPRRFAIRGVPRLGVSAAAVRATYYKAWVFLAADVLPPMPEAGFAYPQLATGKPSLYVEGPPGAAATAAWESLLAMQHYAHLDPETAWSAYRGLMTLVRPDGELAGEGLPSRKAQTAAALHALTGDTASLADVYPALRRHLLWAEADPRWIFKDSTPTDQKDAQFVASVLVDMGFARDLAATLGETADVAMWEAHRAATFTDYLRWFWPTPTAEPVEMIRPGTSGADPGNVLWIGTGLHLDLWPAASTELAGLLRRFLHTYRPGRSFAGFVQPKYPDISYTVRGLIDQGHPTQGLALANCALRDVVRANQFAETYDGEVPQGHGVRPSYFGAGQVIDAVWLNNGYRSDVAPPDLA